MENLKEQEQAVEAERGPTAFQTQTFKHFYAGRKKKQLIHL